MADGDFDRKVATAFTALDVIEPPDLTERIFDAARGAETSVQLPDLAVGPRRPARRRWVAGAAAAVVLFGGGLGVGLFLARDSGPGAPTMLLPATTPGSGTPPSPGTEAPPTGPTPATEAAVNRFDQLTEALRVLGADVDGAPAGASSLDGAVWCGAEQPPEPDPTGLYTDEGRRRCLLDAHLAAAPAVFARLRTTTEGDPIVEVWRTLADGTVEVFTDATRDAEGSGRWETQSCGRLTTRFPGPGVVPTTFGCAEDIGVPVVHTSEPMPEWFTSREVLPLCGYAIRLEDVDAVQRGCFERAIVDRQPGEFAYLDVYEGVWTARWFRVTSTGEYEVFVQTITEGAPGSPTPTAVWERYACAFIGTVEGPGDTFDHMPVFRPEDCAAGPDAEPPPTTTTTTPVTAPPGTIMASPPPT